MSNFLDELGNFKPKNFYTSKCMLKPFFGNFIFLLFYYYHFLRHLGFKTSSNSFKVHQTPSNSVKLVKTGSNSVKFHQIPSNSIKFHQTCPKLVQNLSKTCPKLARKHICLQIIHFDLYTTSTINLQIGIHSLTRDCAYWYEIASFKLSKIYRLLLLMLRHFPLSAPLVQSLLDNFIYVFKNQFWKVD